MTTSSRAPAPDGVPGGPSHPVWSPDGKRIAFSVRTGGNGLNITASTLWTTSADGATQIRLDAANGVPDLGPAPDACRAGSDGQLLCQQKGNECAQDGNKRDVDGDCCNGSHCIGGFCTVPPPR